MVTMQIWTNRLLKELDGIDSRLPAGISLSSHDMEPESGVCKAFFEAALKATASGGGGGKEEEEEEEEGRGEKQEEEEEEEKGDGGGKKSEAGDGDPADSASPPTPAEGKIDGEHQSAAAAADEDGSEGERGGSAESAAAEATPELLRFKIEMDLGLDTRYPFECPVIRVLEGDDVIPTSILSGDGLLSLPGSDAWTPSSTIVNTLQDIADMVLHAKEAGLPTGQGGDDAGALERGELRPGALVGTEALSGCLFPCTPPAAPLFSGSVLAPGSRRPLDRFVGVTDRQLLELEAHRTRMNKTVVVLAIPLSSLKKLKFRRGASVTVILKTDEAKEFLTPQSYECVKAVTERLEKMGIAGHQTTAGAERQVDHASSLMAALGRKEAQFGVRERPDLTLVEECMDLFRQAAELYSAADDPRHEEVLAHMHRFLQREDVLSALGGDGSPDGGGASSDSTPVEGAAPVGGAPAAEEDSGGDGGSPEDSGADGSRAVADLTGGGSDDQTSATTGPAQEAAVVAEGDGSTPKKTAAAAAATARRTAGTPVSAAAAAAKRTPGSSRTSPSTTTTTVAAGRGGARRTSGGGRTEAGGSGAGGSRGGRASPSSASGGVGKTAGLSGRSTTGRYGSASRKDSAASNASPNAKKSPSSASPSTEGGAAAAGGRGKTRGGGRGGRGTRGRGAGASGAKAASGTSS